MKPDHFWPLNEQHFQWLSDRCDDAIGFIKDATASIEERWDKIDKVLVTYAVGCPAGLIAGLTFLYTRS